MSATPASHPSEGSVVTVGVYEKALPSGPWDQVLAAAARAGFSFLDLSIDETASRLARLDWTAEQRLALREASSRHGVQLGGLCLSAHRRVAPGSADADTREQAYLLLVRAIDLARDLGIPVVQVAGYYAYYESPRPQARTDYIEVLRRGAAHAARAGVLLGLENVDGTDVVGVESALSVVEEIGSPWFQLYPDIGNFVVQSRDPVQQLQAAQGRTLALHVKDARAGEPRRVPMGTGAVRWAEAFAELARQAWSGRIMIELWCDDAPDAEEVAAAARRFVVAELERAGITVLAPPVPALAGRS